MASNKVTRIALIGMAGAGKSAVGNTLLGMNTFRSCPAKEYVTLKCETCEAVLESGRKIKVADTPSLYADDNMHNEILKFFEFLAPGPHAILVIVTPNRRFKNLFDELHRLFEDEYFLRFTILVFTRKNDIMGEYGCFNDIHEFIKDNAYGDIINLYEKCGRRAVTVENRATWEQRKLEANEILNEIDKLDGVFDQEYFLKVKEIAELKREQEKNKPCNIM